MDDVPSHTKNKVGNKRKEPPLQTALLPEVTADIMDTGSKSPPSRAEKGGGSIPQWGKEYGVAIGATLLAFLLRLSLASYLNDRFAHAAFLVRSGDQPCCRTNPHWPITRPPTVL